MLAWAWISRERLTKWGRQRILKIKVIVKEKLKNWNSGNLEKFMNAWKKKHLVEGSKSVGVCRDGRCLGIWSYMCFMGPFCENRFPPSALNWILIIIFETIIWKSIILLGWVLRVRGVFLRGFWGKWDKLGFWRYIIPDLYLQNGDISLLSSI